jgi:hypothetical protein
MNQPTSIQMLDAAIWQELGGEKANDAEAVTIRSARFFPGGCSRPLGISRNGGDQTFCKGSGLCVVSLLRLGVLDGLTLSAFNKMRSWMGRNAQAFYLLADLKGPIRSDPRRPRYFIIDPSIQSDSIDPIQFSNLVFDLLGIHNSQRLELFVSLDVGLWSFAPDTDLRFTTPTHLSLCCHPSNLSAQPSSYLL